MKELAIATNGINQETQIACPCKSKNGKGQSSVTSLFLTKLWKVIALNYLPLINITGIFKNTSWLLTQLFNFLSIIYVLTRV